MEDVEVVKRSVGRPKKQKHIWTADQLALIEWHATPRYSRIPPTEEMFGQSIGVNHQATLWKWKQIPGFWDKVNERVRENIGKKLPEIYGALIREAESGSFPHIRLLLELAGEYKRVQHNVNQVDGEMRIQFVWGDAQPDDDDDVDYELGDDDLLYLEDNDDE
jgi:hypothetical protein